MSRDQIPGWPTSRMCSIMSLLSQLHDRMWLHVCCLTLDIDIPVIALLICLYKHRQTITLHAFSMFICLHTCIPDHDNYFVCSINHTLSEWLYCMPEIKSFGVGTLSELKCISLLKTNQVKNFVMDLISLFLFTHENSEIKSPTKIYDFTVFALQKKLDILL